jgi:hypothetical protein
MTFLASSYEPPSIGLVWNDTLEGGLLAKPIQFQEQGQISKRRSMGGFHFGIQWHHLATLPWDALPANLQYLNLMEPIVCVASAMSL